MTGQASNYKNSQLFARIEQLRVHLDLTWDDLAERLDVNRSLFFHLKAGRTGASQRFLSRLRRLEQDAGLRKKSPIDPSEEDLARIAGGMVREQRASYGSNLSDDDRDILKAIRAEVSGMRDRAAEIVKLLDRLNPDSR